MSDSNFYEMRKILPDMYYSEQYNNDRRSRVVVIGCCLRKYQPFNDLPIEKQEEHIRRIERSCYNHACYMADTKNISCNFHNPIFVNIYNIITFRVQKNLLYDSDNPDNKYLVEKIVDESFDIKSIGSAKSSELCPAKTKKIRDEIEKRKRQKIIKKYSTQHECFKCGGRKTTEVEIQLRSLDEGSTLIITCEVENCGNVWKISS